MGYGEYVQTQCQQHAKTDKALSRSAGYLVDAKCDHPDCEKELDRGLDYLCGNDPFSGCQGFYCDDHSPTLIYADELEEYTDDELKQLGVTRSTVQKYFEIDPDSAYTVCQHEPIDFTKFQNEE